MLAPRHGQRLILACLLFAYWLPLSQAQPGNDRNQGLLLFGEFGELCTMCEAVLMCEESLAAPEYAAVPVSGDFTLYHVQARSFWSQIATIWEWFIANFQEEPISGHQRPVRVFEVASAVWGSPQAAELQMELEPALLSIRATGTVTTIDRRTHQRFLNGAASGYCQRLPLWDALDAIEHREAAGK
ncbi:MAG: hypothetical protein AAGI11_07045 [Pseudomonadota bacterium]